MTPSHDVEGDPREALRVGTTVIYVRASTFQQSPLLPFC